jgi:hypothetical protein
MARKAASFRSTARLAPSNPRDLYIRDWPGSVGPDAGLPLQETITIINVFGNAQASIKQTYNGFGNAQATIKQTYNVFGQSQADIKQVYNVYGQAQATIIKTYQGYGNAQSTIRAFGQNAFGQAQGTVRALSRAYGNAQADITQTYRGYGNAQGFIFAGSFGFGQAQGSIKQTYNSFGQAQGLIANRLNVFGRAQATIKQTTNKFGKAQAFIIKYTNAHGQAQAYVKLVRFGYGQAAAQITTTKPVGQAQAFILSQRYLVQYNGYQLPGYAQAESFDSIMKIETAHQPYRDMAFSEYLGLENKTVSLRILVTGDNYLECKNQMQLASTMLRSQRAGFRPLYVQHYYKHYDGLVSAIKLESDVNTNTTAEYTIEFECKPWLESDILTTVSGTSLISTVGRTIYDGGWTPVNLTLSGNNITVSGYTLTGDFTGFISISGAVSDLQINTEEYTATMNNENANNVILNDNYQVYIGPEMTYFSISGAIECEISYRDRWYL